MECARRKTKEQQRKKKESDLIVFDAEALSRQQSGLSGLSDKKLINKKREVKAAGKKSVTNLLPQVANYKKLLGKSKAGPLPPLEYDTTPLFDQIEIDELKECVQGLKQILFAKDWERSPTILAYKQRHMEEVK